MPLQGPAIGIEMDDVKTGHYVAMNLQKTGQSVKTAIAKTGQSARTAIAKTGQFLYDGDRAELVWIAI